MKRHIDLVHSAALREANGDVGKAEDITQATFVGPARRASKLVEHPALVGWLYTSVRRMAANVRRADQRRERREKEAQSLPIPKTSDVPGSGWQEIRLVIDDALHELGTGERTAIVLRFFEQQSLKEVGRILGINENAARTRVNRAMDRLQGALAKRGISTTPSGLAGIVAAGVALVPAPTYLAASVARSALAASTLGASTMAFIFDLILKLKTGLAGALIVGSVATPLVMQHQAKIELGAENRALREDVRILSAENRRLSGRLRESGDAASLSEDKLAELMKLRGEVALLRTRELESDLVHCQRKDVAGEGRRATGATGEIEGGVDSWGVSSQNGLGGQREC